MTSLFDIAADLTQYGGNSSSKSMKAERPASSQSALGILNETFETIYSAQQYRSAPKYAPLARSLSMTQLQPSRLSESKSSDELNSRLRHLTSGKAEGPRRMTPAIAVAGLIIPPPPTVPPPPDHPPKQKAAGIDPDLTAKRLLREATAEIEQLLATTSGTPEEEDSLVRMLSDKYLGNHLSKLPGTPFVLLVRKKVTQKLEQLQHCLRSRRTKEEVESPEEASSSNNKLATDTNPGSLATWKHLQKLTPAQHEVLQNLLRLPEQQLLKLPKAQLELVQFAKRYDKLLKATPHQLRHMPIEHQKLVRSIQLQQIHATPKER